jgi:IstB-like ATP binding protein
MILDLHRQGLSVSAIARQLECDRKTVRKYIDGGLAEWGDLFGHTVVATALLDRLLHHAIVIQIGGASYRLRQHADLIPENLRVGPLAGFTPPPRRRGRPPKHQPTHPGLLEYHCRAPGEIYFAQTGENYCAIEIRRRLTQSPTTISACAG